KTKTSKRRGGGQPRPDGELRSSQMITTYGPGALVDLVEDAIIIPGLEHWHYSGATGYEVAEPRLAANLRRRGLRLSASSPFRRPPIGADDEPHRGCGVAAVEFPSWFSCPNRGCERLLHKRDTDDQGGHRKHRCPATRSASRLVPVRFAVACANGHLDDFPWEYFVHDGRPRCDAPELQLVDRGSGDLSDVYVKCGSCREERPMSEARSKQALPKCRGLRPWLGAYVGDPTVQERDCEDSSELLLRTASKSYFRQVESALSIPKRSTLDSAVLEFLQDHDERSLRMLGSLPDVAQGRRFIPVLAEAPPAIARLSDAELWSAIEQHRRELAEDDETIHVRETEYRSITAAPQEKGDHRFGPIAQGAERDFYAVKPEAGACSLPAGVADLVLLKHLREVQVLTGFTRLEAPSQNIYGEFDLLRSRRAELSVTADWLPAAEIRGEGFFFELDHDALDRWEQREVVRDRAAVLEQGFVQRFGLRDDGPQFPGIRFYLLHTVAHLLITQVALECGYSASAIRERIYCSPSGDPQALPMAGILLSTGSSGSEGTLGGLVDQGRRLDSHLRQALRRAKLCSHDPVCARQQPAGGNPGRALLGAACHGCLFIAECSCERSNQYLDRTLVVPAMGVPGAEALAFFSRPAG
ncbi:MAG: DUF1998 domain-containing protein, partial [Nannocystaceae bacterium]